MAHKHDLTQLFNVQQDNILNTINKFYSYCNDDLIPWNNDSYDVQLTCFI